MAQSDVDKTNQSYYGESKLNYLTTDGSHEGLVPLRMCPFIISQIFVIAFKLVLIIETFAGKEGPIHDVQWSTSGLEFAVVYGCMFFYLYSF